VKLSGEIMKKIKIMFIILTVITALILSVAFFSGCYDNGDNNGCNNGYYQNGNGDNGGDDNGNGDYDNGNNGNGETIFLAFPTNLRIEGSYLIWDSILYSIKYEVRIGLWAFSTYIKLVLTDCTTLNLDVFSSLSPDIYQIQIRAMGNDKNIFTSLLSGSISHVVRGQLNAPVISLYDGDILHQINWTSIRQATAYAVYLDGVRMHSQSIRSFNIDSMLFYPWFDFEFRDYKIQIRALGDGEDFYDSELSEPFIFTHRRRQHPRPSALVVWGGMLQLGWWEHQPIEIRINDEYSIFRQNTGVLNLFCLGVGEFEIKKRILAHGIWENSDWSESYFINIYHMDAPKNITTDIYRIVWDNMDTVPFETKVDGEIRTTGLFANDLIDRFGEGIHQVYIRNREAVYSDLRVSEWVAHKFEIAPFAAPINLRIYNNTLVWDGDDAVQFFDVYIDDGHQLSIARYGTSDPAWNDDYIVRYRVRARARGFFLQSELSDEFKIIRTRLNEAENLRMLENGSVVWDTPYGESLIHGFSVRVVHRETGRGIQGWRWIGDNTISVFTIVRAMFSSNQSGTVDISVEVRPLDAGLFVGAVSSISVELYVGGWAAPVIVENSENRISWERDEKAWGHHLRFADGSGQTSGVQFAGFQTTARPSTEEGYKWAVLVLWKLYNGRFVFSYLTEFTPVGADKYED